ncbi:Asp-tRNA(Asn)/Glu-tRNA(Gln) amidotransferase GatCAB subunit C [Paracoccus thiocyanatus]|uniref:Asp-tRNA(Asn)/Glu-tRNA(Gln) amidotransferase GatCAB subunit C n=2 Tax=Paracoccus thiocyanatus TaxID=34006 RepID=A0A3D8PCC2_9RHOB|nr:Asp-tRNA(Asn)/Glu-tRNA(Gln) amidotransferase GatCAB subunit C [Paracoccus thiocyanatus]
MIVTHWGVYHAEMRDGRPARLVPVADDPAPSPIADGMLDALHSPARILRPAVRRSFLTGQAGAGRGAEPFVELPWDEALDLAAGHLRRIRDEHGNQAIFGGSYGWSSAGRFHHAQSQVHRFLNMMGGYTRSVQNYSFAAADVILPHVTGDSRGVAKGHTLLRDIAQHTELLIAFGGLPAKNAQVSAGGILRHILPGSVAAAERNGARMVNISPIRDDIEGRHDVDWIPIRPNTDVALMLGLAHVLASEGLHDRAFLDSHATGYDRFEDYLLGRADGTPKTPEWAAAICGVPADSIRDLARAMPRHRTMIAMAWSLQRADHGEQPYWMAITLAAMLGQIGLPGGGYGFGYASVGGIGAPAAAVAWPSLPQGRNPVQEFIPVARIADMLLGPGERYDYNGQSRVYPDIRAVYWAGGNPFHHHQDLNRLRRAWQKPDLVIVHDSWWNPVARHADIVFPVTTALERNDIACSSRDTFIAPSHKLAEPAGETRPDYEIFAALAKRLGCWQEFTEGRDEEAWLRHLYDLACEQAVGSGVNMPDFETFWQEGLRDLPEAAQQPPLFAAYRADPAANALRTPSGRIEIHSAVIEKFGYADCPGHPAWLEPLEWLGSEKTRDYPLHLLSNQPKTRLHSQYDVGSHSRASKIKGREPMRMHPDDAAARGIREGDLVRVFNGRGACLAGVTLSDALMPGVVQLSTGAWFDPDDPAAAMPLEKHGNPNVLTRDAGTSRLAQGPSANSCLVEVEPFRQAPPAVTAFTPPELAPAGPGSAPSLTQKT